MTLPSVDTPLYNHPLPDIERWLASKGCQQDVENLHRWVLNTPDWQAEITMDVDSFVVRYLKAGSDGEDIQRVFKYSLTRQDLDAVIFSDPLTTSIQDA
jgi:hypothetical protein